MAIKSQIEHNENVQANTELLETLKTAIPQYFDAEGNFKTDKFTEELKTTDTKEAKDGYRLSFVGKEYARLQTGMSSKMLIAPDTEHNAKPENANSQNVFITGDNLEALRHLQNAYSGKIKMIYIDPPYNTGKEFVYNDKFDFDDQKLKKLLNYNDDEIARLKSINGKSSHSAWLTFMYPRLKLAQKLLTDDGVIFVSIDDNEQANLKLLMDDVFGEGNFVADLPTIMNLKGNNDEYAFAGTHEYTLVYCKIKEKTSFLEFSIKDEKIDEWENDEYGFFKKGANLKSTGVNAPREKRPNLFFPLYITANNECNITRTGENDIEVYPITNNEEMSWRWEKKKFVNDKHNIIISRDGNNISIYKKQRPVLGDLPSKKPKSLFYKPEYSSGNGTQQMKDLFESKLFDNPKPLDLIKDFIEISTDKNALILDFFAGSATTAHAVMQLNAEDGGNRKYIMVQLDEETNKDSEARKAGYNTIDEISRERIKRAAKKIRQENPMFADNLDLGFKHYRLQHIETQTLDKILEFDKTQLLELELFENMVDKLGGLDTILTTWLIDDGYDFQTQIEDIELNGYNAPYIKETGTIYLIKPDFDTAQLKELLNKIGKGELAVSTIVVFPYSFTFEQMLELQNNVKNNIDRNINIIKRY